MKKVKLGDVGTLVTGKTPLTGNKENYNSNDVRFITPEDLTSSPYNLEKSVRYISKKGLDSILSNSISGESILIGSIGSNMGNVGFIEGTAATNQQINSITKIKTDFDPKFIYYYLTQIKSYFRMISGGSTTPIMPKSITENIIISVPSFFEQKKITNILSSIDKKIELNKKINKELEQMARELYDYWFVQFDFPNAEGKPYKSSGGSMVFSKDYNRKIPFGWTVKMLKDIERNIITGKTPSTKVSKNFGADIPFICIGDLRESTFVVKTKLKLSKMGGDSQKKKYIPEGSICVSCIASPGLIAFSSENSQTNQQLNSIVIENDFNKYYLYFSIQSYFKCTQAKVGNTMPNMNKEDFSSITLLSPKEETLVQYNNLVTNFFEKIKINIRENKILEDLRDQLLPMLMNGQINIKD